MKIYIALFSLLSSFHIEAADWQPIEGIFAITAEHYLDPGSNESQDSHLRFQLEGLTAKELFRAMEVEPYTDDCTDAVAKSIKNMQCLFYPDNHKYQCHFSIDLHKQKIDYGVAC